MKAQKIARLKDKAYRDAFVASQISVGLPFQIRALREAKGWKQSRLAAEAGMLQPRISSMESPGATKFNLETLRRLASAFDVALAVRFVPFSELVDWSEDFNPDSFKVPSFDEDFMDEATADESLAVAQNENTLHGIPDYSAHLERVRSIKAHFVSPQKGGGRIFVINAMRPPSPTSGDAVFISTSTRMPVQQEVGHSMRSMENAR